MVLEGTGLPGGDGLAAGPVRVELARPGMGWVDLHPVVFDATGHGRQADLDGGHFDSTRRRRSRVEFRSAVR